VGRGPRTDTIDFRRRVANSVGVSTVPVVAMHEGASSGEDVDSNEPISILDKQESDELDGIYTRGRDSARLGRGETR
jgi:hypothetical protein